MLLEYFIENTIAPLLQQAGVLKSFTPAQLKTMFKQDLRVTKEKLDATALDYKTSEQIKLLFKEGIDPQAQAKIFELLASFLEKAGLPNQEPSYEYRWTFAILPRKLFLQATYVLYEHEEALTKVRHSWMADQITAIMEAAKSELDLEVEQEEDKKKYNMLFTLPGEA